MMIRTHVTPATTEAVTILPVYLAGAVGGGGLTGGGGGAGALTSSACDAR